jgi:EAL domain-containing protein (putative c-di-GMP-specific phosphodiesterase class I)
VRQRRADGLEVDDRALDPDAGTADATSLAALLGGGERGEGGRRLSTDALRAIRTHLGMEVAFVSEFVGENRVFRLVDAEWPACPVQVGSGGPLEDSYCQRVVDGRLPELIHDAGAVPAAAELEVTSTLPVGAHLAVPIRLSDGRVYGTLCCFSRTPDHSLNDRDLAIMRVFADLTAAQVGHRAANERRTATTIARVRAAAGGEGLSMVFQPIVATASHRPVGFEALARFDGTPRRGPDAWFADAAAVGLGVELELAAVRLALPALPHLPAQAYLALNVSPGSVLSGRLDDALGSVAGDRILLEITEHQMVETYDGLEDALRHLRRRGVRIAVDDAGAGYASFRHILRLRPDVIKLDMTLTRDIDTDRSRRALACALIGFARETGSTIVAEGVETTAELATLRRLGVDAAQGYHLGRPGPLSQVAKEHSLSRR